MNRVTTSAEHGLFDLQSLVVPALLATSLFTLSGCAERPEIPKQPDTISRTFGNNTQKIYAARDLSLQPLLTSCAEVHRISNDLLESGNLKTLEDLKALHRASVDFLEAKSRGSAFPHQPLVEDSYRALQETIDALEKGAPIRHTGRGSFFIQDHNYHQVKRLHSDVELLIAGLAVPAQGNSRTPE